MHKVFTVKNKVELFDKFITKNSSVLDVGFWGQGKTNESPTWPHKLIKNHSGDVYGIDIVYDEAFILPEERFKYQKAAAENFNFNRKFDIVFAGDLIEHLINPGLFLENAKQHTAENGRLIMTTPNTFNLFVLVGKLTRPEPVINSDHTFYFNRRTIQVLLEKCGWEVEFFGFMYTLDYTHKESLKKKFLNLIYRFLSFFTPKYYETLVVVAKIKS
jgi:2-polyprenyl-3-methyl-5-hydroxy-6-metoxy-1,4-benzoquinol methylase